MTGVVALELSHIAKQFGGVDALTDANLRILRGSVHALLGENGAGKTTLMQVAFGMVRPESGTISIDGSVVTLSSPRQAIRYGVGMVHQRFTIVGAMTVAENVALGGRGSFRALAAAERVREIGRDMGLVLQPEALASTLPASAQQRLEIIKALAHGARTLILDEPTAVLAPAEVDDLMRFLRAYASRGGAVVLITHKLREAIGIADEVTVLRAGRTVAAIPRAEVTESGLAQYMMGESGALGPGLTAPVTTVHGPINATVVVRAHNLKIAGELGVLSVRQASFTVGGGEILGVAGVEGGGFRELLRALAGLIDPESGELELPDKIAFIPELSQREGLVLEMSLIENLALKGAAGPGAPPRGRNFVSETKAQLDSFGVRAANPWVSASTLSGGNQQKLVLARELGGNPTLIVAENPTRGLDIVATAAVHSQMREAALRGAAVVFHSADLDELLALASRIVVMFAGCLKEVSSDRAAVGAAMLGVA